MEENKNNLNNQDQNQNNQYQNSNQQQDNYYSQQNYGNNFNDPYGNNQNNNQNYYNQQNYGSQGYNQNGYNTYGQQYTPTNKTGIGVVCALFLDLIGLIIGLCSYKEGTLERKTFIKAWIITYCIKIGVCAIIGFVIGFCFPDLILNYYNYY